MDVFFPSASDERTCALYDAGREKGTEWEPWEAVPGGRLKNLCKSTINLTARVYVASVARAARLLEMGMAGAGLLGHYEKLVYDVEEFELGRKAKWTKKKGDRFSRRQSMAM